MQTYGSIIPGGPTLGRLLPNAASEARDPPPMSRQVRHRLEVIRWCEAHGGNVALTARHFGHSRSTVYCWLRRYREQGLRGLEDRSRRPHKVRQPLWTELLVETVRNLREQHPRWGKDKLVVLVRAKGFAASTSMVGRILSYLKKKGLVRNPDLRDPWMAGRSQTRPYAVRKPRDYVPKAPGDLVQIDSADVRLDNAGHWYKHFSARDVVSRWDVLGVYGRATALTARDFLDAVIERMPGPVRAIQVDGGSEFKAEFEEACREKGLRLFVLPPRSPKLNGCVERAQRTHKEEFYQMLDPPDSLDELRRLLLAQELCYNTVRPHQALGQLTPQQWLLASRERG
jgi:transposase InsO family protein